MADIHDLALVIGDKNLSSWSLRPWLLLKRTGLPFREIHIRLRQLDTTAQIAPYSPSGKVPVLLHGDLKVWDSLAICEYVAELAPHARLWPEDRGDRAVCRSVCAEMHSGFLALRSEFPMEINSRITKAPLAASTADIARIVFMWAGLRAKHAADGPFLFGHFTVADAMYAPVATRFRTYGIQLRAFGDKSGLATAYVDTVLALPEMEAWAEDA
jgi:glutathione S-transferase